MMTHKDHNCVQSAPDTKGSNTVLNMTNDEVVDLLRNLQNLIDGSFYHKEDLGNFTGLSGKDLDNLQNAVETLRVLRFL